MHAHCLDNMGVAKRSQRRRERSASSTRPSPSCSRAGSTRSRASARRCRSRRRCACIDNASRDGSAELARAHPAVDDVIELPERRGKAYCDSELLRRARGRYALLLNEDSELLHGATLALYEALEQRPHAACAGARLLRPDGTPQACAWRFPTPLTALAAAVGLHRVLVVQSRGSRTRVVDWCQSSALLVRRSAAAAGRLPRRGVLRLLRRGRLREAPARRGLAQRVRARGERHPRRAALHEHGRGAAHRRALAQPRPLHAKAPLRARRARGALADRVDLRGAGARRARAAGALAHAATGCTCARRFTPQRGRGPAGARATSTTAPQRGALTARREPAPGAQAAAARSDVAQGILGEGLDVAPGGRGTRSTRRRASAHERARLRRAPPARRSASRAGSPGSAASHSDAQHEAGEAVRGQQQLAAERHDAAA